MGALVKQIKSKYLLSHNHEKRAECRVMGSGFEVSVPFGSAELINGQEQGTRVTEVKRNQTVLIYPPVGLVKPTKYEIMVNCNRKLFKHGTVSFNTILPPVESELFVQFKAFKDTSLPEVLADGFLFLYQID